MIDKASDKLLIRPLITQDKEDIIDLARKVDTDQFSETSRNIAALSQSGRLLQQKTPPS